MHHCVSHIRKSIYRHAARNTFLLLHSAHAPSQICQLNLVSLPNERKQTSHEHYSHFGPFAAIQNLWLIITSLSRYVGNRNTCIWNGTRIMHVVSTSIAENFFSAGCDIFSTFLFIYYHNLSSNIVDFVGHRSP